MSHGEKMSQETLAPLSQDYIKYCLEDPNAILKIINLRVWYPVAKGLLSIFGKKQYIKAVNDVTLTIRKGEVFSLVGESGCGKTTLGKAIVRLVPITSGSIILKLNDREVDLAKISEKEFNKYRRYIQVIFQDPYESLNPGLKIKDILMEPLIIHKVCKSKREMYNMVKEILEQVHLTPPEEFMEKYPHELSGGQRQRVAIARALILRPKIVVADEPISMLDVSIRADILNLMMELREKFNLTYIYITHDLATARYVGDRIGVLYLGFLVEIGPSDDVVFEPAHPYTKALLAAVPSVDGTASLDDIPIKGDVPPNPLNLPKGCPFYPRCIYAKEKCANERPPLVKVGDEHFVACWYPL